MNNSAQLKDDNGKYAKLPNCPVCGKKVHTEENDENYQGWEFDASGEFTHDDCLTAEHPSEGGFYYDENSTQVYLQD